MPAKGFTHERGREGKSNVYLTPPDLIEALGPFDLDPCAAPAPRPWPTARTHYDITVGQDGLALPWKGLVFCNPPYGPHAAPWLVKCADHGDAIALIFARTETQGFVEGVWKRADAALFLEGRLMFRLPDGSFPLDKHGRPAGAGAPSVLVAYGARAVSRLEELRGWPGQIIKGWREKISLDIFGDLL